MRRRDEQTVKFRGINIDTADIAFIIFFKITIQMYMTSGIEFIEDKIFSEDANGILLTPCYFTKQTVTAC